MFRVLQQGALVLFVPIDQSYASLLRDVQAAERSLQAYIPAAAFDSASQVRWWHEPTHLARQQRRVVTTPHHGVVVPRVAQAGHLHLSRVATPDVLAMEVQHAGTGLVVQPQPRPGPRWASVPVEESFAHLRARTSAMMQATRQTMGAGDWGGAAGTETCNITAGGYRFVASQRGSVRVWALFGSTVPPGVADEQAWAACGKVLQAFGMQKGD